MAEYVARKTDETSLGATLFGAGAMIAGVPVVMALFLLASLPLSIYAAWCDLHIWNWFAAGYFRLPLMPLWVSFGIGMWVRLQATSAKVVKDEKTSFWGGILTSMFLHTASLGLAYVVHRYMAHA